MWLANVNANVSAVAIVFDNMINGLLLIVGDLWRYNARGRCYGHRPTALSYGRASLLDCLVDYSKSSTLM